MVRVAKPSHPGQFFGWKLSRLWSCWLPPRRGDESDVIPISLARRLFELANEPKTFMLVSGGKHLLLGLAEVFPRVREWLDEKIGVARRYGDAPE